MSRRLVPVWVLLVALLLPLGAAAQALTQPPFPIERMPIERAPTVSAPGWILYDDTFQIVLDATAPDVERPMASTTKIMTALVALEEGDPEQLVTISVAAADVGEAEIGLVAGERLPLGLLVRTLLVRSANDAAMAVAEAIGGSVEGFVELMNRRAAELGLEHTHFTNPHGLDEEGHYSSPRDLLTIARDAMDNPLLAEAVGSQRIRLPNAPDGSPRVARATNRLLDEYTGAIGIKTGFTFQAGLVLVAAAERDGRRLYAVVMGSEGERAHFRDAIALLDHGFDDFGLVPLVASKGSLAYGVEGGDSLNRQANLAATLQLATLGLNGHGAGPPAVLRPPPELVVAPREVQLPALSDSVRWVSRYWKWVVGDG